MNVQKDQREVWWRSHIDLALLGFFAVAGFFLLSEHRAHAFQWLPWLLLLVCLLLHTVLHSGKGRHHD